MSERHGVNLPETEEPAEARKRKGGLLGICADEDG
jgi:hypothetical protein